MSLYYCVTLDLQELYLRNTRKFRVIPCTEFQARGNDGKIKPYFFKNKATAYVVRNRLNYKEKREQDEQKQGDQGNSEKAPPETKS